MNRPDHPLVASTSSGGRVMSRRPLGFNQYTDNPAPSLRDFVETRIERDPNSGCWLWAGSISERGYGCSRGGAAHRDVYQLEVGPIPTGLVLDHKCRVRCCVNPQHLRPVTPVQNVMENSLGWGALNAAKTHCVRGHALAGDNLRVVGHGRVCVTCLKIHRKAQNERRKHPRAPVTSCPRGHPYDAENTYRSPAGSPVCKTCRRAVDAARSKTRCRTKITR